MFFTIITFIFAFPPQIILIIGDQVLPIDYATGIIEIVFCLIEIIISIYLMSYVVKKQTSVFYLRNTLTELNLNENKLKSSKEIEDELFYNFPNLNNSLNELKNNKKTN